MCISTDEELTVLITSDLFFTPNTDQECSDILLRVNQCVWAFSVHVLCGVLWWRDFGNVFLGKVTPSSCSVIWLSPSLCSSKGWWGGGVTQTSMYSLTGVRQGDSRLGVKWRAVGNVYEGKRRGGEGGCCLYIIAGHSSGKTSDGSPRLRGAEWRERSMHALWC